LTPEREIDERGLATRIEALPGFAHVSEAAERAGLEAWAVGGAVRDSLLALDGGPNLDVVVAGDPVALARELGGEVRAHERFNTAIAYLPDCSVDIAMARAETYPSPGALPEVRPAGIDEDLERRDFTVNALAVPLGDPGAVIDHHGGRGDLQAGLLRVLHDGSFVDDPTRALRAARYAARLGFEVEPVTLAQLVEADLTTVSTDRVDSELERLAAEPQPARALRLLHEWDLLALDDAEIEAFGAAAELAGEARWRGSADLGRLLVDLVRGDLAARARLLVEEPASASAGVEQAGGRPGEELLLARALGGDWLDRYVDEWRGVRLAISGDDLLAAGIPQGPAIGRGLAAALRAKLDHGATLRDDELRIALEAARE
jgi:tRNA nucleotidyltransferase (CCA-adding enzyme)